LGFVFYNSTFACDLVRNCFAHTLSS